MADTKVTFPEELYNKLSGMAKKHRKTASDFIVDFMQDGLELFEDITDMADDKVKKYFKRASSKKEEKKEAPKKAVKKTATKKK